jgi:nitrate reductase gamma subunit
MKIITSKPWFMSKTVWISVLTIVLGILEMYNGGTGVLTIVGIVNLILRTITNTKITIN